MTDELDDLLKELKEEQCKTPYTPPPAPPLPDLEDEDVNKYVLQNASKLVQLGIMSVESLKDVISQSYDAEEIESFASLIRSVNDSLNTVNKINIQNKKIKAAKEIKQMDLQRVLPPTHQTNVLIATREEIIKGLVNNANTLLQAQSAEGIDFIDV
jgi:hypothetical protein